MNDVKLPESVQTAFDQLAWKHGCFGLCSQSESLRRAIAAALLRAEKKGHGLCCRYDKCRIPARISAQADALEGKR